MVTPEVPRFPRFLCYGCERRYQPEEGLKDIEKVSSINPPFLGPKFLHQNDINIENIYLIVDEYLYFQIKLLHIYLYIFHHDRYQDP